MQAKPSFSLKDQLFNADKVDYLATLIARAYPDFPSTVFRDQVLSAFPNLELKERIAHISTCLYKTLPVDYSTALHILLDALPPELDPTKSDDDFGDFIFAPLSHFVATYGCTAEHLARSLSALKEMTKRFSAEDAIRYFINAFPNESMAFLADCAADENYHVRRLASEGTRPKLPWSQKLTIDYQLPLSILDALHADKTRYVTRSVANHLNDISKLDPELVIGILSCWQKGKRQSDKEMTFMIQHSLRTLVKQGNKKALTLLGFGEKPDITVTHFTTSTPEVIVGDALQFALTIRSNKQQRLVIDYLMTFAIERGAKNEDTKIRTNKKRPQKVFKLKQLDLKAGEVVTIAKKHPMRLMTTRRLFAGEHQITLQVNGEKFDALHFELIGA